MPRDSLTPVEPISGPRKRTLTEKAKDAAQTQLSKRVRAAAGPSKDARSKDRVYSISGIFPSVSTLFKVHNPTDTDDDEENEDEEDPFLSNASRGTSPIGSDDDDDGDTGDTDVDLVCEVDDSDDDVAPEKPAESAQAELSTR
jgi:hypothetical protein